MSRNSRRLESRLAGLKTHASESFTLPERPRRNQRAAQRRTCYKFATLDMPPSPEMKCIVRDISMGGVRIAVEGQCAIPGRVTLRFADTGAVQTCRVVWQHGNEAGLAF